MRRTKLFMIICIIGIFLFVIGHFTYAWVGDNGMTSPIGLTASLHKSYFESGDGGSQYTLDGSGNIVQSDTGPFEIKYPIQLYYLAWLQALGYFESDENEDGTIDQYYFYVSADLDMSGFVLPPIGTKDNPFLGQFDGQGHMIYNVNIVSDKASTTDSPETTFSQTEIVGLFGVVGTLSDTANSYTTSSGTTYTYDSSINEVKDLYISNVNVNTKSNNTLIGIAAGYVNGKISNVGVINSSITFSSSHSALDYTSNLSDYALIGYCTDAFKDNAKVDRIELGKIATGSDTYVEGDDGTGAGGSIAMQSIFTRIQSQRSDHSETDYSYPLSTTYKYDMDGNLFGITNGTATTYRFSSNSGVDGNAIFMQNSSQYTYLGGGTRIINEYYSKTQVGTGFFISDGDNYLTIEDGYISNVTDNRLASVWQSDSNGRIYSKYTNGTTYYLYYDDELTLTEQTYYATSFTKTANNIYYDYSNWGDTTRYYLTYSNGWNMTSDTTYSKYAISTSTATNRYLISNGTDLTTTTNVNDAYIWDYSGSSTGYGAENRTISTTIDGIIYYLTISTSGDYPLSLDVNSLSWRYDNSRRLSNRVSRGRNSYYYYYFNINNSGEIQTYRSTGNPTSTVTFTGKQFDYDFTLYFENAPIYNYVLQSTTNSVDFSDISNSTYIPLKADEASPFTTLSSNTGYIISSSEKYDNGDIRVSRYGGGSQQTLTNNKTSPLTMTFLTSSPTSVTTSNASSYGLQKFNDSYNDYYNLVKGTYVYGLHFMDSRISKDKYITLPRATIINETFDNLQMPTDCIDFTLRQRGFINFYAGTYFKGSNNAINTAFFSFHQIFRNDDMTISDIKEIENIYGVVKNNQINVYEEYIYEYSDGSFSGGYSSIPAGYTKIFDMNWLKHPTGFVTYSAYYFEVPANEGEYALGSVDGEDGAYLIYLDLQANKQTVERTIVTETWQETKITNTVPQGVAVVEAKGNTVDNLDSVTVQMPTSTSGTTTISRSGDAVTYTNSTGAAAAYIGDGLTANGSTEGSAAGSIETILTERLTYIDYNLATKVTKLIVTTTVITTNSEGTTRTSTQTIDGATNSEYSDDGHAVTLGDTIAKFVYTDKEEATVTVDYGFDYKTSPTTYTITFTSDKDLTVKHQLVDSSYSVSINGTALKTTEAEKEIAATSGD